ncbi:MAG: hypothetical protein RAK17_05365, partial [Caldisphaera sp.]|nr:hypothetical protein [Caldisphaera sp.]
MGENIPLLCQKKLANPDTLPAFSLPTNETAVEFAGVITNLTKPINVAMRANKSGLKNKADRKSTR